MSNAQEDLLNSPPMNQDKGVNAYQQARAMHSRPLLEIDRKLLLNSPAEPGPASTAARRVRLERSCAMAEP